MLLFLYSTVVCNVNVLGIRCPTCVRWWRWARSGPGLWSGSATVPALITRLQTPGQTLPNYRYLFILRLPDLQQLSYLFSLGNSVGWSTLSLDSK